MLEQRVDLRVDLLVGRLGGRHLDLDGVVARELERGLRVDFEVERVGLAVDHEVHVLLVELGLADREDAGFVDGLGIRLVHQVVGHDRADVVLAERAVDDRARRLAATETGDGVLACNLLVLLLDAIGDSLLVDGDGNLGAVTLQDLNFCFHVVLHLLSRYLRVSTRKPRLSHS